MIERIKSNLENPEQLEQLYGEDKKAFSKAFELIYPEIANTGMAKFWKARLDYAGKPEILRTVTLAEILVVAGIGLVVALLIKLPVIFNTGYNNDVFYMKNAAIIVFFGLTLYRMVMDRVNDKRSLIMTLLFFVIPLIYINLLPSGEPGDSLILAYIHLPIMMWFIYGIVFSGYNLYNLDRRIEFIRFNGDFVIVYALIAIAGGVLSAITMGLFESIGLKIEEFYGEYIIVSGAVAAPVVATYLIEKFPSLVSRTASLIALIFSPLVLITLVIFLVTIIITGKDPFNDRDFLLIFNIMLLGVMGIITFSVSESSLLKYRKFNSAILFSLSLVSIVIDLIALSAIFYRLGEFGLTPNRLAVLVSNILVLINLVLIMKDLFGINFRNREFRIVEITTSKYLPVYMVWAMIVIFLFPVIFGMK